jgi:hypothetical protein
MNHLLDRALHASLRRRICLSASFGCCVLLIFERSAPGCSASRLIATGAQRGASDRRTAGGFDDADSLLKREGFHG